MLWLTIKGLLARKRRLFTTALAVTLGVAFMSGTLVLTDTIGRTFDDLFADVNAGTDAFVRGEAAFTVDDDEGGFRVATSRIDVASHRLVVAVAFDQQSDQALARRVVARVCLQRLLQRADRLAVPGFLQGCECAPVFAFGALLG